METTYTLISVILPVYNEKDYIQEAIDSILHQTFTKFELIIVDDASDDGTTEIIQSNIDSRIIYYRNERNLGNYASRNRGMSQSHGKYIAVMDGDDVAFPERLQKEYEYLEKHPDVLAIGAACTINYQMQMTKQLTSYEHILAGLLLSNNFIHSSLLIRKEILQSLNGYDTQFIYAADYDLMCRMALHGKIENLPETLLMYRCHKNQISQKHLRQQQTCAHIIRTKYRQSFIRKFKTGSIQDVDYYTVENIKIGYLICLYVYAVYTKNAKYEEQADHLFDEILRSMRGNYINGDEKKLCEISCGIIYLLRNELADGDEDEVLKVVDIWLGENCQQLELIGDEAMHRWKYYSNLRMYRNNA